MSFDVILRHGRGNILINGSLPWEGPKKSHFHKRHRGSYKSKLSGVVWSDGRNVEHTVQLHCQEIT
jgi:hypothetical protein